MKTGPSTQSVYNSSSLLMMCWMLVNSELCSECVWSWYLHTHPQSGNGGQQSLDGLVVDRWTDWWTGLVDSLVMHTGVVSH